MLFVIWAFLHNIMPPLISKPEHGTYYGLNAQREPTAEEVAQVRERAVFMPQMAHCQQCRADAIGMLGEDRSQEFNLSALAPQKRLRTCDAETQKFRRRLPVPVLRKMPMRVW